MKKALVALSLVTCTLPALSQTRTDYDSAVQRFVRFFNAKQNDSVFYMFSERIQALSPLVKTRGMLNDLNFQLDEIHEISFIKAIDRLYYYKTEFHETNLTLLLALNADKKIETFRFLPYQADSTPTNIELKTPTGTLYGTVVTPKTDKKVPVVLIIAGSGPTDRNGNQTGMMPNTYRMLADSLLQRGIASVRYDKRGIGESAGATKGEETLRFEDMANDAAGFIDMLKNDKRFSKVIILGHSEGSLVGMLAAQKTKVSGLVSVSAAAQRVDKIIKKQLFDKSDALARKSDAIFDSLEKGYNVVNIDPELTALFRPSIQPYMRSWLKYDPQEEIKKLKMPILVIHGANDVQIGKAHAQLLKDAKPEAEMLVLPEMSHIMKPAPAQKSENLETYYDTKRPLSPDLIPAITTFISKLKK